MLLEFRVKNFRSIRNETILNLRPTNNKDVLNHVLSEEKTKANALCAIYGFNASGKSNLYKAFKYMSEYVVFYSRNDKNNKSYVDDIIPFKFDNHSSNEASKFEITFTMPDVAKNMVYNYGFVIEKACIKDEWLRYRKSNSKIVKTIYKRDSGNIYSNVISNLEITMLNKAFDDSETLITTGKRLNIDICTNVFEWFFKNEFADFSDISEFFLTYRMLPCDIIGNNDVKNRVLVYLQVADNSIVDIKINEVSSNHEDDKRYEVLTVHKTNNSKKTYEIPLSEESSGVIKLFSMFDFFDKTLNKGSILFVDELNAKLHPALIRYVIGIYTNKELNKNNSQFVFTTHDVWQLSKDNLRRDEIWFVEKDDDGNSSLVNLASLKNKNGSKIRNDGNYMLNYMKGNYVKLPFVE